MDWDQVVRRMTPYMVRINTPDGSGTGFLCFHNIDKTWIGIATAAHVVSHADDWEQPIRITRHETDESKLFGARDRVVFPDYATDSAVVLIPTSFDFPEDVVPLLPTTTTLPIGASVGWLGFPGIARNLTMCFFTGTVSAIERHDTHAYLIDGVAVNGVSGGPVVYHTPESSETLIVGVLAAYRPNRQYGESLPGLSVARDMSHFHGVLERIRTYEEAQAEKADIKSMLDDTDEPPEPIGEGMV